MPPLWPWREVGRSVPALAGTLDGPAGSAAGPSAAAVDSAAARFMMFATACQAGLAKALVAKANPGDLPPARALVTRIDSAARADNPLSPRETEVASLIARAMTNRQIADQLVLSERTVETHVRSILAKLGYTTRTEIATWSLRRAPR